MRVKLSFMHLCAYAFLLLLANSCTKPPKDFDPRDGNNVYKGCRVKKITFNKGPEAEPGIVDFTYNSKGNPVSVIKTDVSTGNPNYLFKYDNKGRLIELIGAYRSFNTNGSFEQVHRYTSDAHGRIIGDTIYTFGLYGDIYNAAGKAYSTFTYDNLNRMVKETRTTIRPGNFITTFEYTYDEAGNRIIPGTTYDSKLLSINKTNKIWMFVFQNYSLNSPAGATGYNSCHLPTGYPEMSMFNFIQNASSLPVEIEYE